MNKTLITALCLLIIVFACKAPPENPQGAIKVWQISDPDVLNPFISSTKSSSDVTLQIFQKLVTIDLQTYELVPVLARSLPEVSTHNEKMQVKFELREDAIWTDGVPVSSDDYHFTLKSILCPTSGTGIYRSLLDFIDSVETPDAKTIIIHCNRFHTKAAYLLGYEIPVLPKHVYDADNNLGNYNIRTLLTDPSILEDSLVKRFGLEYGSEKFTRNPDFLIGSGPYKLVSWEQGQKILLERKENWWGHKYEHENHFFKALPKSIEFIIIPKFAGALAAFKSREIDILRGISPSDYSSALNIDSAKIFKTNNFSFSSIALNHNNPNLKNKNMRRAIAHLIDYDRGISQVMEGAAMRTIGPIPRTDKKRYNDKVEPYTYQPKLGKKILNSEGWTDIDNDGFLENSKGEELAFNFVYNAGNTIREAVGGVIKNSLEENGIRLNLLALPIQEYRTRMRSRDFDFFYMTIHGEAGPPEMGMLYSSDPKRGTVNIGSFKSHAVDSLIDILESSMDEKKSTETYLSMQELLHKEIPCLYLWNSQDITGIQGKFTNFIISGQKPGYWAAAFKQGN